MQDPEKHVSNPLNAFLMVKRFTYDWKDALKTHLDNGEPQSM